MLELLSGRGWCRGFVHREILGDGFQQLADSTRAGAFVEMNILGSGRVRFWKGNSDYDDSERLGAITVYVRFATRFWSCGIATTGNCCLPTEVREAGRLQVRTAHCLSSGSATTAHLTLQIITRLLALMWAPDECPPISLEMKNHL